MAEIHFGATLTPSKIDLISAWIGHQRWYAAKGHEPQLTRIDSWRLDDPDGEVGVEILSLLDSADDRPVVYQVPLTYRAAPLEGADDALVGTMDHSALGPRWVYDAPHDPVYAACLLALVQGRAVAASSSANHAVDESVRGIPHPAWPWALSPLSSRVLAGEQSNTSIIIEATTADGEHRPVIVKVFRTLAAGENPDVVLQSALREAGCELVPAVVGAVKGQWRLTAYAPENGASLGGGQPVHFAFAQEFLPGVEDAWRVASRAVEGDADFTAAARALGEATAQVHRTLAATLGTSPTTHEAGSAIVDEMRSRYVAAVAEVEELARFGPLVDEVLVRAADAPWPPMQRIHGDYHLGQVLHSPQRGWMLLDFEGEPMRPLLDRALPDQWIRDVAGMLRSFDYCGGAWEHSDTGSGRSARAWVRAAQGAFLDGYAARSGDDPRSREALLTAFELDKAMYEVVYEARNRPDWVEIPLAAIERLTGSASGTDRETDNRNSTTRQEERP